MTEPLPVTRTETLRDDEVQRLFERLVGTMAEDPLSPGDSTSG
jgi:hypothetical protein